MDLLFPKDLKQKYFGYMPSDGANCPEKYINEWRNYATDYGYDFELINNSLEGEAAINEADKLLRCGVLVISGGNTFTLLRNLKRSGLDKTILEFSKRDNYVIVGFSAGAIVMTPTIEICNTPGFDENLVALVNLEGLNLVDFEVFPHYGPEWAEKLKLHQDKSKYLVKVITNDEYLVIEK